MFNFKIVKVLKLSINSADSTANPLRNINLNKRKSTLNEIEHCQN